MAGTPGFLLNSKEESGALARWLRRWDEEEKAGDSRQVPTHRWEGPPASQASPTPLGLVSPGHSHRVGFLWGSVDSTGPQPRPGGVHCRYLCPLPSSKLPTHTRNTSPSPGEGPAAPISLPPFPQASFPEISTNSTPYTPLNPCTCQLDRTPNTPKPRALKIWCKEMQKKQKHCLEPHPGFPPSGAWWSGHTTHP